MNADRDAVELASGLHWVGALDPNLRVTGRITRRVIDMAELPKDTFHA